MRTIILAISVVAVVAGSTAAGVVPAAGVVVPAASTPWVPGHAHHVIDGHHGYPWVGSWDAAYAAWAAGHTKVASENALHLHSAMTNYLAAHAAHAAQNAVNAQNHPHYIHG